MSDANALGSVLIHGQAMEDLAEVRAQQIVDLTEELAAAQAVIAECGRLAGQIMFDQDAEPARTAIMDVSRNVGTDALQAVKAAAWDEGYTRGFYDRELLSGEARDASEGPSENPYRKDKTDE